MRIRHPLVITLSGFLFAKLLQVLFFTLRLDVRTHPDANPYAAVGTDLRLYAVWHDSMVIAAFGGRHVRTVALTSHHRDGSFVASVLKAIGVPTVRGSTKNRGSRAVRQILSETTNSDIVMTPDGPRGPSRQMSRGIVFLASRSGRAIVPTAFSCERYWRIRGSWSDLIIPKPFSRVYLVAGDPIEIPAEIPRDQLGEYAAEIQTKMEQLENQAGQLAASRAHH